jgi:hypothetical protein
LKLPQAPALPHVTVQSTPKFFGSEVTLAARVAVAPAIREAGGVEDMVTTTGAVFTIFAVAVAETVGSVVDFAVMVTVPPVGTAVGPR